MGSDQTVKPPPRWLAWAREIQALSQTGLAFSTGQYDIQRYRRLTEIAAEIVSAHTALEQSVLTETFLRQPGYATPKIDVRGAIIRDGRILLVQEKADGRWCMPGGWADVGELPSEMVAREAVEESGLRVAPRRIVGVYDANRMGERLEFFHAYKVVFLCDILGGEPRAGDETLAAEFFPFEELPPLSSPRTDRRHLEEVRAHLSNPNRPVAFD